jgi:hypothetical protein
MGIKPAKRGLPDPDEIEDPDHLGIVINVEAAPGRNHQHRRRFALPRPAA